MYNPPTIREYPYVHPSTLRDYKDAYDAGYHNSRLGLEYVDPHDSYGYNERKITYEDELSYQYFTGFYDYKKI